MNLFVCYKHKDVKSHPAQHIRSLSLLCLCVVEATINSPAQLEQLHVNTVYSLKINNQTHFKMQKELIKL